MKLKLALLLPFLALLTSATLRADDQHNGKTSRSPVLLLEVNNSGDVRLLLTVYDDGEAILARKDGDEPDGEICSTTISAADLEVFENTLRDAGALHLPDTSPVPDVTRKTVSFFAGPDYPARTHGNTFSYYRAEGPYLVIARAMSELIGENFGDCI
jgi:hypothetical protein